MAKTSQAAHAAHGAPAAGKKRSRATAVLVVWVLVAAAFGGGALWGHLRARADRAAWQKERAGLQQRATELESEVRAARARAILSGLDERLSKVLIDLAEKNYGLARDEASTLARSVSSAAAELPGEWRGGLDQAASLLDDAARSADALSPDARVRTMQARDLLRQLAAGTAAGQ